MTKLEINSKENLLNSETEKLFNCQYKNCIGMWYCAGNAELYCCPICQNKM